LKFSPVSSPGCNSASPYAQDLLQHEKVLCSIPTKRVTINRKDLPYPQNLDEAKRLWRQKTCAWNISRKKLAIEERE